MVEHDPAPALTLGPSTPTAPRRWTRYAVVAPWLLAGGIAVGGALGGGGGDAPTPAAATAAPVIAPTDAPVVPPPATTAIPAPLPATTELAARDAARTALGLGGLTEGSSPAWVVDLALAPIETVADGLGVVVAVATVIERVDGGWGPPVRRAAAVPLVLDPPAVAGPAWPVLPPPSAVGGWPRTDVTDPGPLDDVVAALHGAGWAVDDVIDAAALGGELLELDVVATAPGATTRGEHTVWVRHGPTGASLLGGSPPPDEATTAPHDPDASPDTTTPDRQEHR